MPSTSTDNYGGLDCHNLIHHLSFIQGQNQKQGDQDMVNCLTGNLGIRSVGIDIAY